MSRKDRIIDNKNLAFYNWFIREYLKMGKNDRFSEF